MSNCINKINFPIKIPKPGFVANDTWQQKPGLAGFLTGAKKINVVNEVLHLATFLQHIFIQMEGFFIQDVAFNQIF